MVSKPEGAPAPRFSDNHTHSARVTEVDYAQAGDYVFAVTVRDRQGGSAESQVQSTVRQACEAIRITPEEPTVHVGETLRLHGVALDQFGHPMSPQSKLVWKAMDGGEIHDDGVFRAASEPGEYRIKVYRPDVRFHRVFTIGVTE